MDQKFLRQLRALLVLGRVSNLPTVWSNCLAGWWLSGGGNFWKLPFLFFGAAFLYTGGMFLNDAFDAAFDRQRRSSRPIPSGKISEGRRLEIRLVVAGAGNFVPRFFGKTSGRARDCAGGVHRDLQRRAQGRQRVAVADGLVPVLGLCDCGSGQRKRPERKFRLVRIGAGVLRRRLELCCAARKFSRQNPALAADSPGRAGFSGDADERGGKSRRRRLDFTGARFVDGALRADDFFPGRDEHQTDRFRSACGNRFCGLAGRRAAMPALVERGISNSVRRDEITPAVCAGDLKFLIAVAIVVSAVIATTAIFISAAAPSAKNLPHIHGLTALERGDRRGNDP